MELPARVGGVQCRSVERAGREEQPPQFVRGANGIWDIVKIYFVSFKFFLVLVRIRYSNLLLLGLIFYMLDYLSMILFILFIHFTDTNFHRYFYSDY